MKILCSARALLSWLAFAFLIGLCTGVLVDNGPATAPTDVRASVTAPQ